jgi:hypothetical protein
VKYSQDIKTIKNSGKKNESVIGLLVKPVDIDVGPVDAP